MQSALTGRAFFNASAAHAHQQRDAHVRRDEDAVPQELLVFEKRGVLK